LRRSAGPETTIRALDLLESPDSGSNVLRWWTQSQPIRTLAQVFLSFPILKVNPPFTYQYLAEKANELHRLGMSMSAIARSLNVTDKTIRKALRFAAKRDNNVHSG